MPLSWPALYGRDAPTEVEIGSGKGRFLLELARERPDVNFLAVERAAKYHTLVCQRAATAAAKGHGEDQARAGFRAAANL